MDDELTPGDVAEVQRVRDAERRLRQQQLRAAFAELGQKAKEMSESFGVAHVEPEPKHPKLAKVAEVQKKDGWDWYWLFWLFGMVVTGFIIPEANALLNKQKGDTLSENIREWLKTDTPGGGASWLVVVGFLFTLVTWLAGHIMSVPGWPLTGG